MTTTRDLDGAEAGGQFVRTALALSVLRGEPIRIENVRGNRSTPGLGHQHLAALETMVELTDASVTGAELGAETVRFDPTGSSDGAGGETNETDPTVPGGTYEVDIGTAGSITLLFDAVVPLATVLESPLTLTVTGGTDVKWSPPVDYFRHVKLPLLRRYGLVAACEVDRRGFYPDGGGRATLRLAPSRLEPIDLTERGPLEGVRLYSTEAAALADRDVAHRQAAGGLERLSIVDSDGGRDSSADADSEHADGTTITEHRETTVASDCPGTAIVLRIDHGTGVAGFAALGERGTPAERVGENAADAANRFLAGDAPVDRHLADQLLPFLAVSGGRLRVPALTEHVEASCALLESFGFAVAIDERSRADGDDRDGEGVVSIAPEQSVDASE
ncbi:RNA 3'-terminal phosphate cyclase [Natrarchaeobaculum aegyptiacum]|uniref:RNA 3'-terminal phosphate cyclase n=1 Tax=Natrarchaeobaculum aegyptiacum TaxID=745377 RepID=A0A2Z2HTW1_9EURY|nr:RNA 3'-terminal phosphate cyclase [Natrarchaeobaculum aegyptiacum]ARS90243.1 RNA 3'-terminal-phosphate cyclase [Natrarchaeobaculum aegyptiacum]